MALTPDSDLAPRVARGGGGVAVTKSRSQEPSEFPRPWHCSGSFWYCLKCDFYFEAIAYTKVMNCSPTHDDSLPSRLVA